MCSNCTISEYVDAYNNCLPGPIYIIQNAYLFKLQRTTNFLLYYNLDILFLSNHNIHKSSCGLCFWASDALIDRF